ncbi:solute carrier family 22 member 21-like [Ostrea edulis]|uniref:solute carrier family 22 member 21-like n=1 Tax=Ostrea edulis TaxID=37623 RepID=UPI0024AEBF15|nr:solute carrier family 22 member 21-like [Ostrea edulis]
MTTRLQSVDVDSILHDLGPYGPYQVCQYLYSLLMMIPVTYPVLIYVFIGYPPNFQCQNFTEPSSNHSIITNTTIITEPQSCDVMFRSTSLLNESESKTVPCPHSYVYEGPETVVTEWDLVCDRESLGQMSTAMVMVGQMLGAVAFSVMVDKYGRHGVTCVCFIAMTACSIGLSFTTHFVLFVIIRLMIGAFQQGIQMAQGSLVIEMFPTEFRATCTLIGALMWSFSVATLSLFAWLLQNHSWRYLQLLAGLVGIHCLGTHWIQHESLRWLVANGKKNEIKVWIHRAAKWNKKDPEKILSRFYLPDSEELVVRSEQTPNCSHDPGKEKYNILDIVRRKRILFISLIIWTAWFTVSLSYYGLYLMSSSLSGDIYLNFFLIALAESPSQFIAWYLFRKIGRRFTTIGFFTISGVSLIASALILKFAANADTLSLIFNLFGMFSVAGAFSCLVLFTPELYPTNLRSTGLGLASTAARIGSILSPFASSFAIYVPWGPGVTFGALCLSITFLFLCLPETKDIELPTTVEDLDKSSKNLSSVT